MGHYNCDENILKGSRDGRMLTQGIENDCLSKDDSTEVPKTFYILKDEPMD